MTPAKKRKAVAALSKLVTKGYPSRYPRMLVQPELPEPAAVVFFDDNPTFHSPKFSVYLLLSEPERWPSIIERARYEVEQKTPSAIKRKAPEAP